MTLWGHISLGYVESERTQLTDASAGGSRQEREDTGAPAFDVTQLGYGVPAVLVCPWPSKGVTAFFGGIDEPDASGYDTPSSDSACSSAAISGLRRW